MLDTQESEICIRKRDLKFIPGGIPRFMRIYDNGGLCDHPTYDPDWKPQPCCDRGSADRYTIVFTGRYRHKTLGEYWYLASSTNPYHPQGIGLHQSSPHPIDRPKSGHLGKRIKFEKLPEDVQLFARSTYIYMWDIGRKWSDNEPTALQVRVVLSGIELAERTRV